MGGGGGSEASGGELTDVAPSLSLAGGDTSIIFVATKGLSRQTRPLSGQKYACRDKFFVATKLCLLRQIFVATNKILSRQPFCCDRHIFVATKDAFCRDKNHTCGISSLWYISALHADDG